MGKNKEAPVVKNGRPPLYNSAEELEKLIDAYFKDCDKRQRPPTIAGIAYWLGMDRKSIYNYEKKEKFFHIIKRARDKILSNLEEEMILRGNGGTIFLAKNYGYSDKQEIEQNTTIKSDGFLEALKNETRSVWSEEDEK